MEEVLVLGYGNTLRRDDAVGPLAAEEVSGWGRPGVAALALPQLLPELAEPLSRARLVIFIDAAVSEEVQCRPLVAVAREPSLHHAGDPQWLLSLTESAYGRCPPAWLITVPVTDLSFGEGLSPRARVGLEVALEHVERLLLSGR
jgi:hydrogenase maturation protease